MIGAEHFHTHLTRFEREPSTGIIEIVKVRCYTVDPRVEFTQSLLCLLPVRALLFECGALDVERLLLIAEPLQVDPN